MKRMISGIFALVLCFSSLKANAQSNSSQLGDDNDYIALSNVVTNLFTTANVNNFNVGLFNNSIGQFSASYLSSVTGIDTPIIHELNQRITTYSNNIVSKFPSFANYDIASMKAVVVGAVNNSNVSGLDYTNFCLKNGIIETITNTLFGAFNRNFSIESGEWTTTTMSFWNNANISVDCIREPSKNTSIFTDDQLTAMENFKTGLSDFRKNNYNLDFNKIKQAWSNKDLETQTSLENSCKDALSNMMLLSKNLLRSLGIYEETVAQLGGNAEDPKLITVALIAYAGEEIELHNTGIVVSSEGGDAIDCLLKALGLGSGSSWIKGSLLASIKSLGMRGAMKLCTMLIADVVGWFGAAAAIIFFICCMGGC